MKKRLVIESGTFAMLVLLSIGAHAWQGIPGDQEPADPLLKASCCQEADIADGPELIGCHASCAAGGVPLDHLSCSDKGKSSGPYVYPGGCLPSTDPDAECQGTTLTKDVPLFFCRTGTCGGGRYECAWESDGSTFELTITDCDGTPCHGG